MMMNFLFFVSFRVIVLQAVVPVLLILLLLWIETTTTSTRGVGLGGVGAFQQLQHPQHYRSQRIEILLIKSSIPATKRTPSSSLSSSPSSTRNQATEKNKGRNFQRLRHAYSSNNSIRNNDIHEKKMKKTLLSLQSSSSYSSSSTKLSGKVNSNNNDANNIGDGDDGNGDGGGNAASSNNINNNSKDNGNDNGNGSEGRNRSYSMKQIGGRISKQQREQNKRKRDGAKISTSSFTTKDIQNTNSSSEESSFVTSVVRKVWNGNGKFVVIALLVLTLLKNLLFGSVSTNQSYYYYSSSSSVYETRTYSRSDDGQPITQTSRKETSDIRSNIPGINTSTSTMNNNNNGKTTKYSIEQNNKYDSDDNGDEMNDIDDSNSVYRIQKQFFE